MDNINKNTMELLAKVKMLEEENKMMKEELQHKLIKITDNSLECCKEENEKLKEENKELKESHETRIHMVGVWEGIVKERNEQIIELKEKFDDFVAAYDDDIREARQEGDYEEIEKLKEENKANVLEAKFAVWREVMCGFDEEFMIDDEIDFLNGEDLQCRNQRL